MSLYVSGGGTAFFSASQPCSLKLIRSEVSERCGAALSQWLACLCSHELIRHMILAGTPKSSVVGLASHAISTSEASARLRPVE